MTDTIERPRLKITYATLRADNEELHEQFERGLERARAQLGKHYPNFINGEPRHGDGEFEDRSPIDENLILGWFARGTRQDAKDAIAAARAAFPAWRDTPWQQRVAIMRRAGDLISERQMELAALMVLDVGKNRLEALGDVEETADFFRYYSDRMEENDGFDRPMDNLGDETVHTRSVLKPHGVWAIVSRPRAHSLPAIPLSASRPATPRCWHSSCTRSLSRLVFQRESSTSSPARARRSVPN